MAQISGDSPPTNYTDQPGTPPPSVATGGGGAAGGGGATKPATGASALPAGPRMEQTQSPAQQQVQNQLVIAQIQDAYNRKRMELIDIPMLQLDRDKFAVDAATEMANRLLQVGALTGYYSPNDFAVTKPGMPDQTIDWQNTPESRSRQYGKQVDWNKGYSSPLPKSYGIGANSPNQFVLGDQQPNQSAPPGDQKGSADFYGTASPQPAGSPWAQTYALGLQSTYGWGNQEALDMANQVEKYYRSVGAMPDEGQFNNLATSVHANQVKTLAQNQFEADTGLKALAQQSSLRGPRNAFQQMEYMGGLNNLGLSKYVDAISGQYNMPQYQAPQARLQAPNIRTQAEDLNNARTGNIYGAPNNGNPVSLDPTTGQPNPTTDQGLEQKGDNDFYGTNSFDPTQSITRQGYMAPSAYQRQLDAIPSANKVTAAYFQGPQSVRDFVLSGAEAKGWDPTDYEYQAKMAALPRVGGAAYGLMR